VLHLLGIGRKPPAAQLKLKLPQVNSFVDVSIAGGGPRGSVCLESLSERNFTIGALAGTKLGDTGVFSYTNPVGRFRFSAKCLELKARTAVFAIPDRVETLQVFSGATQRTAVRIDTTLPAHWRYAPGGKGTGEYMRGSLTDISRSGASLTVDREVKKGGFIELRFAVGRAAVPLVLAAEVMRTSDIENTKRHSLGVRFQGVRPEDDRAIMDFINKRQAERRNRGLA
jgi:hypothetical protein